MWLVVIALVGGSIVGLCLGGRPRRFGDIRLHGLGLLVAGAGCELAGSRWGAGWPGTAIVVAGYVLLLGFAVRNAALTGMVLVAMGLAANLTVIALDGGMPVRGLAPGAYGGRHHAERPGDHLTGLADVVPITPIGETVSAGDLVLALGVATVLVGALRPSRRRGPAGPASSSPDELNPPDADAAAVAASPR
jgi:Family of unknown function (DUF5317)